MINKQNMRSRSEALIISLVGKDLAKEWWDTKNKAFGGITPEEQWLIEPEKVYNYLMGNCFGGEYL